MRAEIKDSTPILKEHDFSSDDFNIDYFNDKNGGALGANYGKVFGYRIYDNPLYWNPIINLLKKYVPNTQDRTRILDLGCAAGYAVKRYSKMGFQEVFGADISVDILKEAARNIPYTRFELFNLNTDLFNPEHHGKFKVVTAFDVIEHTAHWYDASGARRTGPEHVIPKIVEILSPGGLFVMSVPVTDDNFACEVFDLSDSDRSHVSKLPTKRNLEILEASGLEVLEKRHAFLTPFGRIPFFPTALELVARKK